MAVAVDAVRQGGVRVSSGVVAAASGDKRGIARKSVPLDHDKVSVYGLVQPRASGRVKVVVWRGVKT